MSLVGRALERRTHPRGIEESWLRNTFWRLNSSASGKDVTPALALEFPAVLMCVSLIAETIASLPLHLYRRLEPRGRERATDLALYRVLHLQPNPEMTRQELLECIIGHQELRGNCFLNIVRNGRGVPIELWPLHPAFMQWFRGPDGQLYYVYTLPTGEPRALSRSEVMHVRGMSWDGLNGLSRTHLARETIGGGLAAQEYASRFFANDSNPGGILSTDQKVTPDGAARMTADWEQMHKGLDNAHRIAVLEQGVKFQQVGIDPEKAQLLEQRKFTKADIAGLWRVPLWMIGEIEKQTSFGSGVEQQMITFKTLTLVPRLTRFELRMQVDLVRDDRLYAEFDTNGLLRGDAKSRAEALEIQRRNGVITANQWADLENLNPIDSEGGDTYFVPMNWAPMDKLAAAPLQTKQTQPAPQETPNA